MIRDPERARFARELGGTAVTILCVDGHAARDHGIDGPRQVRSDGSGGRAFRGEMRRQLRLVSVAHGNGTAPVRQ
jgi:hypothetical protein